MLNALNYISPSECSYQEWLNIGMALKNEGLDVSIWDNWSRNDSRYHSGECQSKWNTFTGSSSPITKATIFKMAMENGYREEIEAHELDWDSEISYEIEDIPDMAKVTGTPPHTQLIKYLETLFEADENVGYVTSVYERDGRFIPGKGSFDRTAGQLIQSLSKCNGDIGAVLGDYNPEAGAWIRFNPLDGEGVKNENVTDFRYCLVESDSMDIAQQRKIIENMRLPVACLVFSGKKSIHAIVHVGASNKDEYRKRVEYIYKQCENAGLKVDIQNKNPSRLSRMPGVKRGDSEQTLLATNIGFEDFLKWEEYVESVNDNLPDEESLASVWDNMPSLAPSLIENVLRQGHKMLIAGPSKAGKSFALIELSIAIAEGLNWFGFKCTQGKVLYVNLELDRASCLHRFKDVYNALNTEPNNLNNIDIWNLRGKSVPMDKLAPKLIRRAKQKNYIAVIIDPIYKVITGDENSADQMAAFCNQFDKICTELGTAVIYCHHHSKGSQAGKQTMDRASGSGVFARDPDALLDMSRLYISDDVRKKLENEVVCKVCKKYLANAGQLNGVPYEALYDEVKIREYCYKELPNETALSMEREIEQARQSQQQKSAWRIDGTLREFPKFEAIDLWFDYPLHVIDSSRILKDTAETGGTNSKNSKYGKNFSKRKSNEERKQERLESLETAFEACNEKGQASIKSLMDYTGKSEVTIRKQLKEHGGFWIDEGIVGKK